MVGLRQLTTLVCGTAIASQAIAADYLRAAWPNGPFVTSGRWIADAGGSNVTYVGVNWPGHGETMVPEGLQHQSIATIVGKIKSLGMNVIRLTYAIEMIDQVEDNGGDDIPIQTAFVDALGKEKGSAVYDKVIANNPSFDSATTRLQVFDAIAAECAKQEIYVHLDNHVSRAGWCCTPIDGNAWWGDLYFSAANWTRGLSYMANHGKSWPNLMSMSLRNELRQPLLDATLYRETYNWETWYRYVKEGASAINSANPDVLVFLSGLNSDVDLGAVVQGTALTPGTDTFSLDDFDGFADRLVLELHNYEFTYAADNCTQLSNKLLDAGFSGLSSSAKNQFPVIMTEFGFPQDATTWQGDYASCMAKFLQVERAGWTIWVLAGSYYLREGAQDSDEPWGLLTHDWSDWRSPEYVDGGLMPLVKASLAGEGGDGSQVTGSPDGDGSGSGSNGNPKDNGAGLLASALPGWALVSVGCAALFTLHDPYII